MDEEPSGSEKLLLDAFGDTARERHSPARHQLKPRSLRPISDDDKGAAEERSHSLPAPKKKFDPLVRDQATQGHEQRIF
jgi:hypothetical protein